MMLYAYMVHAHLWCIYLLIVIPFTVIDRLKFPSVLVVYFMLDALALGMSTSFFCRHKLSY